MSLCFKNLIGKYFRHTPSYSYILDKYFSGENVKIDHWAHRSLGSSHLISCYQKMGYILMNDVYNFPRFNTSATWLCSPQSKNQRVFVSQCIDNEISDIKSAKDYEDVYNKNQYLAWTQVFGNDINHVAISVKNITKWYDIINSDPKLKLSTNIQVSRDGDLLQFGLKSDLVKHTFMDGSTLVIPSYFVEFAERKNGREGFESQNADAIFDSTAHQKIVNR